MYDGNDCNVTEDLGTIMRSMDFCWFTQYSVILMRLLGAGVQVNACMQELISRPRYSLIEFEFVTARP